MVRIRADRVGLPELSQVVLPKVADSLLQFEAALRQDLIRHHQEVVLRDLQVEGAADRSPAVEAEAEVDADIKTAWIPEITSNTIK